MDSGICQKVITEKRSYDQFDEIIVASDINYFYDKLLNRDIKHEFRNQDFAISESTFSVWLGLDCPYENLQLPTETVYYSIVNKKWI